MTESKAISQPDDADQDGGAYSPATQPQLFDGVIRKRILAFIVDAIIILALTAVGFVVALVLTIVTFGLGSWLFLIVFPVVGLGYNAITVGGPHSATVGMRTMGLRMHMWNGGKVLPLIAAFHALLFWVSLYSLIFWLPNFLWPLFDDRKRCLHDLLAGVVITNRA